jgi:acyl-CoA synthetase (AMP-forming)/AMP-acid ligase II/acyl carrier protein
MTATSHTQRVAGLPFGDLRRHGDQPALLTDDGIVTYQQLAGRVDELALTLAGGRRLVLVRGCRSVDTVVAYLAALTAGHPVILAPAARSDRSAPWLTTHDPDIVLDADGSVDHGGGLQVDIRREVSAHELHPDLALLLTTSGSTGSPRLVRLSHQNLSSNAAAIAEYLDLDTTDRGVLNLPLHYCYGLSVLNSHLTVGSGVVVTDLSVVDECFWTLVEQHGVTGLAGVPHTFDMLDASGFADRELGRLRYVTQAGGKLAPERVTQYLQLGQRRGWDFLVMYGQTEATARMAYLPTTLAERHPSAIGAAIPGGRLRLEPVDNVSDPAVGELVYSGPNVMMGYANRPADLARGAELTELRTGDLGRALPDGLFEVVGRSSRFAKVFGLRLDLDEIERHLQAAGMPAACAEVDGSLVVVVERRRHVARARSAAAALCDIPPWVVLATCADIPSTDTGKTDHRAVAEIARTAFRDAPRSTGGASPDELCVLYAELLGREVVTPGDSFVGLGADSLSYVELSVRLGERLDRLPRDWHLRTIADLSSTTGRKPRRGTSTDPSVVLRALAILLIVATHANLLTVMGGAHALLAVAGYNAARFLPRHGRAARRLARTAWRIALPSGLWIVTLAVFTTDYQPATALMANGFVGSDTWTLDWQFWFLEAIVWTSLGLAVVLAVPAVRRLERFAPFAWALGLVAVAAVLRFGLAGVEAGVTERYTGTIVLWCFALGWAAARARTMAQRGLLTVLAVLLSVGFFGDLWRELFVVAAIAVLVWVPPLRLPARLATACGVLAGASLSIYLTHWQIYPHLEMEYPVLATLSSLVVGLVYHRLSTPLVNSIERVVRLVVRSLTPARRSPTLTP